MTKVIFKNDQGHFLQHSLLFSRRGGFQTRLYMGVPARHAAA
jgi:hypothetical protein